MYYLTEQILDLFYSINNSIFICFCDDTIFNNGSLNKPYYMSSKLQEVTKYQNVQIKHMPNNLLKISPV